MAQGRFVSWCMRAISHQYHDVAILQRPHATVVDRLADKLFNRGDYDLPFGTVASIFFDCAWLPQRVAQGGVALFRTGADAVANERQQLDPSPSCAVVRVVRAKVL